MERKVNNVIKQGLPIDIKDRKKPYKTSWKRPVNVETNEIKIA